MGFRLDKPDPSVPYQSGIVPVPLAVTEPQCCFPRSGCRSQALHGLFTFCRQLLRDSLMEELSPDFDLKFMRFPYFCKSSPGGACCFSTLASLSYFFWLLRSLVFWLSHTDPYSPSCTAAPLGHSLQMHYFSGYLITKTLLSHCLNSSLLSDLATSVLALAQLPPISACGNCLKLPFSDDWNGTFSPQTISLVPNAPVCTP